MARKISVFLWFFLAWSGGAVGAQEQTTSNEWLPPATLGIPSEVPTDANVPQKEVPPLISTKIVPRPTVQPTSGVVTPTYQGVFPPMVNTPGFSDPILAGGNYSEPSTTSFWAEADALAYWVRGAHLPPLLAQSPPGTPLTQAGVLGTPGTTVVLGDSLVNGNARFGGRFTLGYWLDDAHTLGIEGSFFILQRSMQNMTVGSSGTPILARPFFDMTTNQNNAEQVADPGIFAGSVGYRATSSNLLGGGILLRQNLCCGCNYRIDALGGYRILSYSDTVEVDENLTSTNPGGLIPPGTTFALTDRFHASNVFQGFDVGLAGEVRNGNWFVRGLAKVALGENHQNLDINGQTVITVPGAAPVTLPGGLLALSSNSGHYQQNVFAVVPQFGLNLGYQLTPNIRIYGGYTFLLWSDVLQAANQIDTRINSNLIPPVVPPVTGPLSPSVPFARSELWMQGLDFGMQIRF